MASPHLTFTMKACKLLAHQQYPVKVKTELWTVYSHKASLLPVEQNGHKKVLSFINCLYSWKDGLLFGRWYIIISDGWAVWISRVLQYMSSSTLFHTSHQPETAILNSLNSFLHFILILYHSSLLSCPFLFTWHSLALWKKRWKTLNNETPERKMPTVKVRTYFVSACVPITKETISLKLTFFLNEESRHWHTSWNPMANIIWEYLTNTYILYVSVTGQDVYFAYLCCHFTVEYTKIFFSFSASFPSCTLWESDTF